MSTEALPDTIEQAARDLLNDRIAAVRTLAEARQRRHDKQQELTEAEKADAAAYAAAQRAGWTADELRRVGLDDPAAKTSGRRGRSRTPRTVGPAGPTSDAAPAQEETPA